MVAEGRHRSDCRRPCAVAQNASAPDTKREAGSIHDARAEAAGGLALTGVDTALAASAPTTKRRQSLQWLPDDLAQADRRQPPQCLKEHRTANVNEGKQRSRCNAVRHGLTAETVIGALEDAEDYKAFEAAITADYDAQSAVERELVLRLAGLLWRLRRATTIEAGLFEIQAEHMSDLTKLHPIAPVPRQIATCTIFALRGPSVQPDWKWPNHGYGSPYG